MFSDLTSEYAKLFFLLNKLSREQSITPGQKGYIKDLIIQENEILSPVFPLMADYKSSKKPSTPKKSAEIREIEGFLLSLLVVSSPKHQNTTDNPQQGLPRLQTNHSFYSKSFTFNDRLRPTNQDLDNLSQMKDDSVVEYSGFSGEARLLTNKRFSKSDSMEMSHGLPTWHDDSNLENEEINEDDYREGAFHDYYTNIKDEFGLPSIKEISRMESNQIFMNRSSSKAKQTPVAMNDEYPNNIEFFRDKGCLPSDLQSQNIEVSRLSGLSNKVFKVSIPGLETQLVYHKFSQNFKLLIDHAEENRIIKRLVEQRLYGEVFYADDEQRIERFYPGFPIDLKEFQEYSIVKGLLFQLSFIHSMGAAEVKGGLLLDRIVNNLDFLKLLSGEIEKRMELLPEDKKARLLAIFSSVFSPEIQSKLKFLLKKLQSIEQDYHVPASLFYVMCHNDLNNTNILIKPGKDPLSLRIIDFEYASQNYLLYEFANFFNELATDYTYPHPPFFLYDPNKYPDYEFRRRFFLTYLFYRKLWAERPQNSGYLESEFGEDRPDLKDLEGIERDFTEIMKGFEIGVNLARVFSHYFWLVVAGLSLNMKDLGIDLVEYIAMRHGIMKGILAELLL